MHHAVEAIIAPPTDVDILEMIVQHPGVNLEARDNGQRTAMDWARALGSLRKASILSARREPPPAPKPAYDDKEEDQDECLPILRCKKNGHQDIISILDGPSSCSDEEDEDEEDEEKEDE